MAGPVATVSSPITQRSSQAKVRSLTQSVSAPSVRHRPWPPQNQIIAVGTSRSRSSRWFVTASSRVKRVSVVPWTKRVGTWMFSTRSPGPRSRNQATSSSLIVPSVAADSRALVMCGSSRAPAEAVESASAHPSLAVPDLNRLDSSECHARPGTRASTRQSRLPTESWMPPP